MGLDETPTDPELAKYLNRNYWEQRKLAESPTSMISPTAPSPSISIASSHPATMIIPHTAGDLEIDEFSLNMKTQVEMFVNRMKSNSSRGRNICNDSSVQTLFMNLTSLHSQLLNYIKETDDKRMWYEQLQDKLAQVKDSRAALDVLRQEHVEKMRRIAEEQERQRQLQMAQKLDVMRKKKQEYLQYQREVALQRIQEQEREMQMRQEMQMVQYRMGQTAFPFGSPNHQLNQTGYSSMPYGQPQAHEMQQNPGMYYGSFGPISPLPGQMNDGQQPQQYIPSGQQFIPQHEHGQPSNGGHQISHNQQGMAPIQQQIPMQNPHMNQQIPVQQPPSQQSLNQHQPQHQPQSLNHQMPPQQHQSQGLNQPQQHQPQSLNPPQQHQPQGLNQQMPPQAIAPPPEPESVKQVEEKEEEVKTAELISFD